MPLVQTYMTSNCRCIRASPRWPNVKLQLPIERYSERVFPALDRASFRNHGGEPCPVRRRVLVQPNPRFEGHLPGHSGVRTQSRIIRDNDKGGPVETERLASDAPSECSST